MADVAAAAGVPRATLYKDFPTREHLLRALLLSESELLVVAVEEAMDEHVDDPRTALLAGFRLFLTLIARDRLLCAAIGGTSEILPGVTPQGQALGERSSERLSSAILSRWPHISAPAAALLSECLLRLAISYAIAPPDGRFGCRADASADLLGPYLKEISMPRP